MTETDAPKTKSPETNAPETKADFARDPEVWGSRRRSGR